MQHIELKRQKLDFETNEAYKALRVNVEFSGHDLKVISITSCLPNEGKSTTAYQLARSFAEAGKKTLLIDADLRKSCLQKHSADGSVKLGLVDFLAGKEKLMDVLTATDLPNFFVIFAGRTSPNPSELIGSKYFKKLLESARETFDIAIVDTPPISSVIDGAMVASMVDGVVLIIKHASINYRMAREVRDQIQTAGGKILGVVLNEVGSRASGIYGKYYGKYYGHSYGKYYKSYYQKESDTSGSD